MPIDFGKTEHRFGNGRIRLVLTEQEYTLVAGTNTNRNLVRGKFEDLGCVEQLEQVVEKTKKDGSTYSASVGTSRLRFFNTQGRCIGNIDCNAAPHAASIVSIFYMYLGKDLVKDIEGSFDPDPTKKPPTKKGGVAPRSSKKAPSESGTSSSGDGKKGGKKKDAAPKKKSKPAPPPVEDDSDDDEDLASSSDNEE